MSEGSIVNLEQKNQEAPILEVQDSSEEPAQAIKNEQTQETLTKTNSNLEEKLTQHEEVTKPIEVNQWQANQTKILQNKFNSQQSNHQVKQDNHAQQAKNTFFGMKFQLDNLDGYLGKQPRQGQNKDIFFSLSQQRKEQSLNLLKDWAKQNADTFESNREVLEQLIAVVDQRCRLSVDFLQICYKFFSEKCLHEAKYAKFLLTKPQPQIVLNQMGISLYQDVASYISEFDKINMKQQERVGIFASQIEQTILNGQIFQEFAMLDQIMDQTLSSLIIQKKLLQQHLVSASQKLNKMIPLFAREGESQLLNQVQQQIQPEVQQRQRKSIFDEKPNQNIKNLVINGISNLGQMFLAPLQGNQSIDPYYVPKVNQSLEEEKQQQPNLEQNNPISKNYNSTDISQEINDSKEIQPDSQDTNIKQLENDTNSSQIQQPAAIQQQVQTSAQPRQTRQTSQNNVAAKGDLFKIMQNFIRTQEQVNDTFNICIDKFILYWNHIVHVEKKRVQWIQESCTMYNQLYGQTYNFEQKVELKFPHDQNIESAYLVENLLPLDFQQQIKDKYPNLNKDTLKELLSIKTVDCQAARILVVKEFKINRILPNKLVLSAVLVLSIDKYLGCWDKLDQKRIEDTQRPVFHSQLSELQINKINLLEVEIMPNRHLLFLNIGNDSQKTKLKFNCSDDLEEFITVVEMQKT